MVAFEGPEEDADRANARAAPLAAPLAHAVRDEVLARLLALNQQRAAEDRKLGAPAAAKPKAPRAAKARPAKAGDPAPNPLFNPSEGE